MLQDDMKNVDNTIKFEVTKPLLQKLLYSYKFKKTMGLSSQSSSCKLNT